MHHAVHMCCAWHPGLCVPDEVADHCCIRQWVVLHTKMHGLWHKMGETWCCNVSFLLLSIVVCVFFGSQFAREAQPCCSSVSDAQHPGCKHPWQSAWPLLHQQVVSRAEMCDQQCRTGETQHCSQHLLPCSVS